MRLISLGVVFSDRFTLEQVASEVNKYFPNYLPSYVSLTPDESNHFFIFWEKIVIGDNYRSINEISGKIIDAFPNSEVLLNELGDEPTFWKKHTNSIVGIAFGAGSIITSIAIQLINSTCVSC